jgi:hypothetical protein
MQNSLRKVGLTGNIPFSRLDDEFPPGLVFAFNIDPSIPSGATAKPVVLAETVGITVTGFLVIRRAPV